MRLFDTHAHLGLIFDDKIERMLVVRTAKTKGVEGILSVTNNLVDFKNVYSDLKNEPTVYFAAGISPLDVANVGPNWKEDLEKCASLDKVIAIGETGLDWTKGISSKEEQTAFFIHHIRLANKLGKTLVIHNRNAGKDVMKVIKETEVKTNMIFHCYSEDLAFAESAADLPIYFSFAGNLTYKTVKELHETVAQLPPERILIESESQFMVPSLYKGKRNKPQYLSETLKAVAYYQRKSEEEMAEILWENSLRAFNLAN